MLKYAHALEGSGGIHIRAPALALVLTLLVPTALPLGAPHVGAPTPAPGPHAWLDPELRAAMASDGSAVRTVGLGFDRIPDETTIARVRAAAPASIFYPHIAAAVAFANARQVDALLSVPSLVSAVLDVPATPLADDISPLPTARPGNWGGTGDEMTRADKARALGYDGHGVGLALIDLGASGLHPGLRPRALGGPLLQNVKVLLSNIHVLVNQPADVPVTIYVENVTDSDATDGHGTHTAGIAGGTWTADGLFGGRAPGADLVTIGTGDALALPWILGGWEWVLAHREAYHIQIVSNSYGVEGPYNALHPTQIAIKAANDAGILVLFSAGNNGPGTRTMNAFSQAPWVLAVGSTSLTGAVVPSSSRGDATSGKAGPDLVAPGAEIVSARNQMLSGNDVTYRTPWTDSAYIPPTDLLWYRAISGTSMACPQVAGIAALVWQANPNLTAAQVRQILVSTARPVIGYEYDAQGAGMVDAEAAVRAARGEPVAPRDWVQPTVVHANGDALSYPSHAALVGGPEKSASAFRPRHFFPIYSPSEGAHVDVAWSAPTPVLSGLAVSLYGGDGELIAHEALPDAASGSWSIDLTSAQIAAHTRPGWSASYWQLIVDLDAGAITYDINATVSYVGGALPVVTHTAPPPPPPPPTLVPHAPIVIATDADFTAANGVTRGSGTLADPFVIEGWDIHPTSAIGITIGGVALGTSAYFVIQDVRVHDTSADCVKFGHVAHALVRRVQVDGCDWAMYFQGGSDVRVEDSVIASAKHGLSTYGTAGGIIARNTFTGMKTDGVLIGQGLTQESTASTDIIVEDNTFLGAKSTLTVSTAAAIGTVLRGNTLGAGAFIDLQILPTRVVISDTTWLERQPNFQWRALTTEHPDPGTATIVDAGSDRAVPAGGGVVCFTDARADVQPPDVVQSVVWDFGDGSAGEGANACHTYSGDAATYTARLVVALQSVQGDTSTLEDTATVSA